MAHKGYKQTEEHKHRRRLALIGKPATSGSFKKGHEAFKGMLGKKHTPETKKKISEKHMGVTRSQWVKDKISKIAKESGKGMAVTLNADHIKPFFLFPQLRFAIDNGRTLCKECHKKTDTWGKKVYNYKI